MHILIVGATGSVGRHAVAQAQAGPQGQRVEPQPDTLADRFDGIDADNPQKNDGVFDVENMPERQEPDEVINDLIQFKHR